LARDIIPRRRIRRHGGNPRPPPAVPRRQTVAAPAGVPLSSEDTSMSLSALSTASKVLPTVNFHPHGRHKGATPDASSTSSTSGASSGMTVGQLPVGAAAPLFGQVLRSLQQTVAAQAVTAPSGGTTAATAAAGAAGTTSISAANGSAASVQAFMHSLFQALKQDGLGTTGSGAATTPSSSHLLSSLQTLIQQVSAGAAGNAATANLSTAYQNLVNGTVTGTGAASTASTSASSTAGLQTFLGNLLVNIQSGGAHVLSGVGNHVNTNV
jgi:hypothetical protein